MTAVVAVKKKIKHTHSEIKCMRKQSVHVEFKSKQLSRSLIKIVIHVADMSMECASMAFLCLNYFYMSFHFLFSSLFFSFILDISFFLQTKDNCHISIW